MDITEKYYPQIRKVDASRLSNMFVSVKGMPFHGTDETNDSDEAMNDNGWIDANSRSNGYSTGDLIENPSYYIESLLRDWILRENLVANSSLSVANGTLTFNDTTTNVGLLKNKTDDFYNDAYLWLPQSGSLPVSDETIKTILDYTGSSSVVTVADIEATRTGDKGFITNIGDKIDTVSFDVIGNTSDGVRNGWKFARIISNDINALDLLNEACFESFTFLIKSQGKYKLKPMSIHTQNGDTWTSPRYNADGEYDVNVELSSEDFIYTDYILNCTFDSARGRYLRKEYCNINSSSDSTYLTKAYRDICKEASDRWLGGGTKTLEINSKNLQDDYNTRIELVRALIKWFSRRKLVITWVSDLKSFVRYELGDNIIINNSRILPTGVNNSAYFKIFYKSINIVEHTITFKLIQIPSDF